VSRPENRKKNTKILFSDYFRNRATYGKSNLQIRVFQTDISQNDHFDRLNSNIVVVSIVGQEN